MTASTTQPPHHRIGIYLRKSTARQELSLSAQERLVRMVLEREGFQSVVEVYRDILSGRRSDRSGYQQMLEDARCGKITMLAFHKVNRFGRDTADGLMVMNELRRLGITVCIADLPTLNIQKAEGMLFFTLMMGQGQYEVENLGNESIKGMQEALYRGQWPFPAPFGYGRLYEGPSTRGRIVVRAKEAAIVRLLFRWYTQPDVSLLDLKHRLHALNDQRTRRGKSPCVGEGFPGWKIQYLSILLKNPFYVGRVTSKAWDLDFLGTHRAIVTQSVFDAVQRKFAVMSHRGRLQHIYLLQGLVMLENSLTTLMCTYVKHCDRQYYYFYLPSGKRNYIFAKDIEETVLANMRLRLAPLNKSPNGLLKYIKQAVRRTKQLLQQQLDELAKRRQRLLDLGARGIFSEQEISNYTQTICDDEIRLKHAFCQPLLEQQRDQWFVTQLERWNTWDTLLPEERFDVMHAMLHHVEISGRDGTVVRLEWEQQWEQLFLILQESTNDAP